ncbi:MAG TPA: MerR family transcriptional regulator [Jiangellaceae bacterium]
MRVGELAERTGVSARSVRHYDRAGLLPSARLPNGYRDFGDDAVEAVGRIRMLLDVGLDLDEIRGLLPCFDAAGTLDGCDPVRVTLADHVTRLAAQIGHLERTRSMLHQAQARLRTDPARQDATA